MSGDYSDDNTLAADELNVANRPPGNEGVSIYMSPASELGLGLVFIRDVEAARK